MRRSGPLKTKTPLRRGQPIRRTNKRDTPPDVRAAVLERDGNCKARFHWDHVCAGRLIVHHILPRSRGGGHEMANLIAVCPLAHHHLHTHPAWAVEHGLLS